MAGESWEGTQQKGLAQLAQGPPAIGVESADGAGAGPALWGPAESLSSFLSGHAEASTGSLGLHR